MTDEEWLNLYENFETTHLLRAVDVVDVLRKHFGDGPHLEPPQIRSDLLKLHELAMNVVNNRWESQLKEMAYLAVSLEEELMEISEYLEGIQNVMTQLTDLLPQGVFDEDL